MLGAAMLWGTSGTAQALGPKAAPALVGTARLALGSAILLVVALRHVGGRRAFATLIGVKPFRAWLVVAAVAAAAYQAAFFSSVHRTGVLLGTVIAIGTAPIFTGLIARWWGGEQLDTRWLIATAIAVAGTVTLLWPGKAAGVDVTGILLAIVAGSCYGLYTNSAKKLLAAHVEIVTVLAGSLALASILLLPVLALVPIRPLVSGRGLGMVLWLGVAATAAAYLMFATGLKQLPVATVGTLALAEPFTASLLGLVVLGEHPTLRVAAGAVLVLAGLIVLTMHRGSPAPAAPAPNAASASRSSWHQPHIRRLQGQKASSQLTTPPIGKEEPVHDQISVERDGHVLLIGVNRPEKRNAFDLATIEQLAAAYERLGDDREIRVGVLYGHGDHFSAGLDLAELGPALAKSGPQVLAGGGRYDPFGVWGDPVPKPIVMAVQGIALTLSIELALASDIVVASDDVRFRQLEIGRGILPFGGATFRAPARLGWGNAMRYLLTADEFGAEDALRIGLVQEVVPAGQQLERAVELARVAAAQAPLGVQATLANARVARAAAEQAAVEHLRGIVPDILRSEEAAEGIRSFLERRAGHFSGY